MTEPKDKYEKPIPDGEVPPGEDPTPEDLEAGDDPAEVEDEQ